MGYHLEQRPHILPVHCGKNFSSSLKLNFVSAFRTTPRQMVKRNELTNGAVQCILVQTIGLNGFSWLCIGITPRSTQRWVALPLKLYMSICRENSGSRK